MAKEPVGIDPVKRREQAELRRKLSAEMSVAGDFPEQTPNERDEDSPYLFNFSKGLKHTNQGLLEDPKHYETFKKALQTSDPSAFADVKLVNPDQTTRKFESPTGGHAYVLEGPDAMSLAMPPAPSAGSNELAAELAEVYQMALHRDFPVAAFMDSSLVTAMMNKLDTKQASRLDSCHQAAKEDAERLSSFRWFKGGTPDNDSQPEHIRRRRRFGVEQTIGTIYRGVAFDDHVGPFVSQFMVMGTEGDRTDGEVRYGNQRVDQKVRIATPKVDYMTNWKDWLHVQNAGDPRGVVKDEYVRESDDDDARYLRRPITSLRDLATYVHDDQLYQAYLNATLILLDLADKNKQIRFDPGIPYHSDTKNPAGVPNGDLSMVKFLNQKPFAVFGGPHLLTLVTEVASRALRAVRNQKFIVHRRLRPEALAALMHTAYWGYDPSGDGEFGDTSDPHAKAIENAARDAIAEKIARYAFPTMSPSEPLFDDLLTEVRRHNEGQNRRHTGETNPRNSFLLPMAFPEGSPMHPAYGAGHATVAGACVAMLKAFFDMGGKDRNSKTMLIKDGGIAYVTEPGKGERDLDTKVIGIPVSGGLTLEGELNKLAWNISNARNIAGVHYLTDYIESVILGENITIGILREQMTCYDDREAVSMTLPLFVKRKLPAIFGVDPDREFETIKINPDGSITDG
jgi:hypothetical protein